MLEPVQVDGVTMQGLIDSHYSQTMVRQQLVGPEGKDRGMYLQYICRDIQPYPMEEMRMTVQNHTKMVLARVVKDLA